LLINILPQTIENFNHVGWFFSKSIEAKKIFLVQTSGNNFSLDIASGGSMSFTVKIRKKFLT